MIADVDFRWVMKKPCETDWRTPGSQIENPMKPVLQFRKGYPTLEIKEGRLDRVKSGIRWTDWQYVPVVEEK